MLHTEPLLATMTPPSGLQKQALIRPKLGLLSPRHAPSPHHLLIPQHTSSLAPLSPQHLSPWQLPVPWSAAVERSVEAVAVGVAAAVVAPATLPRPNQIVLVLGTADT